MSEDKLTSLRRVGVVGLLVATVCAASFVVPRRSAVGEVPETTDSCTLDKPNLDAVNTFPTGIWIDASTDLECTSGLTHPIIWTLQIVEVPASNPSHTECYDAEGQQVEGDNSSGETISFGMHGLTTWTDYDFRVGVSVDSDDATATQRWSSEGTEKCTMATPDQKVPFSPWISVDGEDSRVRLKTKLQNYNTFFYAPVLKWQYTYKTTVGGDWLEWIDVDTGHKTTLNLLVTGLDNGTMYTFKTRAVNKAGAGDSSRESAATPTSPSDTPTTSSTTTTTTTPTSTTLTTSVPSTTTATTTTATTTATQADTAPAAAASGAPVSAAVIPEQLEDLFSDDDGSTHEAHINVVAHLGLIDPCNSDGTLFCPDDPLTRVLMAVALTRVMNLETPTDPDVGRFVDTAGHVHEPAVRAIAAQGITKGCDSVGPKFCPDGEVTRGAMASFLVRALDLEVPADPSVGAFVDIVGHTHEDHIRAIAASGITVGCNAAQQLFCPNAPVSRGQMATFLVRAFSL